MSVKYRNQNGQETIIAGLTPGGDIEAGAVATRKITSSIPATAANGTGYIDIVFSEPMPDSDYLIEINPGDARYNFRTSYSTINGFRLNYYNTSSSAISTAEAVNITVTKTYTVQHAQENAEDIATLKAVVPASASTTNQLTTKSYVDNADNALDSRLDDIEDVIPTGASITNQLATSNDVARDVAPTAGSTKLVESGGVKTALDTKQDTLTFDNVPTAGSNNPVKSSGIYTITNGLQDHANRNGAKNFLENKGGEAYSGNAHFVTNSDGSITVNGTANAYLPFYMGKSYLEAGTYTVSMNEIQVGFGIRNVANTNWIMLVSPMHGFSRQLTITNEEAGFHQMVLFLESYASGGTDIVAYPMIRLASDPDDTFEPYAKTNLALTKESFESKANALTGSKNILRNSATSKTNVYGIDWTVYDDGSVKANGNNTGTQSNFSIWSNKTFPIGRYILNGCSGGTMATYHLYVHNVTKSTVVAISFDGDAYFEVTDPTDLYTVVCCVKPNASVTNVMFYPMIRAAGDGDDTFTPYVMTNRELTEHHTTVAKTFTQSSANVATYLRNANTSGYIAFGYSYNRTMITVNAIFTIKASGNALYKSDGTTATSGNENWELIKIPNFPYSKAIPDGPLSGLIFLNRTDLKDLYCSKRGNDLIFAISATDYADFVGKGIRLSATIMLQ